jgi:putative peptidoglycan lipid II flippase
MSQALTESAKVTAVGFKDANKYIFRALLSLSSAVLLVRIAGMLNQVVTSSHFGAGAVMDAYFVAYTLPIVLAYLLTGALDAAVIPVYARVKAQGDKEHTRRFFSTLLNLFALCSLLLTVLLIVFRHQMIFLTAPALDPSQAHLAAELAQLIDPVLFLMVVIAYLECVFNAEGQFGWPAYAGIVVPLTTTLLIVFMGNSLGPAVLCIGMVLGLCLQLGVFLIRAKRAHLRYRFVLDLRTPGMGWIYRAMWPAFLGGLIAEASLLIDQVFSSFLPQGSISALSYSLKIVTVFTGIIFSSVGRAILPFLSRQSATSDMKAFKTTLCFYLWVVGLGTAVICLGMFLLAHPIVQILFQRGAFTADDTNRTALTLTGFVFGLTPMALGFIAAKAFSAIGKNRVLMAMSVFSVLANTLFDYVFGHYWQSEGIALSTSAVYLCNMIILFVALNRMIGRLDLLRPPPELLNLLHKIIQFSMNLFVNFRSLILLFIIATAVFSAYLTASLLNSMYALRIAVGSIVIVALLRYRYALLIAWVMLDAFIGSSISIFNGNHFDTALSLCTLLLMTCLPLQQTFKRLPALAFLLVYLLWIFASIGFSPLGVGAFLTQWILLLDYVAVAVLAIHVLTTRQRLMRLIDLVLLTSTCIALYGIYGYITRQNGQIDPSTSQFRIYATFGAAPAAALYLSIILPLALFRAASLRGLKRLAVSIPIIFFVVAIGLTFTRIAFISLPLSIIIMILFLPSSRMKIGLLSSILVLGVVTFVLARSGTIPLFDRFFSQDISTFNNRTYLWSALLDRFDPGRFLGNGLAASDRLIIDLRFTNFGSSSSNLYIGVLYDQGIIGLALLIVVLISLFLSILKGIGKTGGEQRALFVVALATFVTMLLQSFDANDVMWNQAIGLYIWIIMALPFAACWSSPKQPAVVGEETFDPVTKPQEVTIQQAAYALAGTPTMRDKCKGGIS